jgi:hypothetical protein
MMHPAITKIEQALAPLKQQIIDHPVYSAIQDLHDLQTFMQYHVFAVWDFMSLLKTLQNNLTCVTVPWFPKGSAMTRYLINEIVVGEESDVDNKGIRKSHFELYLEAMQQSGATTQSIHTFTNVLQATGNFETAYDQAQVATPIKNFVDFTFEVINSKKDYLQAAVFTFGREDLIPQMFLSMVNDIDHKLPNSISIFKYYLERHIEIDGDHHSHLAQAMTIQLCGDHADRWAEVTQVCQRALQLRLQLWDGVYQAISLRKEAEMGVMA